MELSKKVKTSIIEKQLAQLEELIYQFTIRGRVAVKVDDKQMKNQTTEQLVKFEKMKLEYQKLLKEVEKNNNA